MKLGQITCDGIRHGAIKDLESGLEFDLFTKGMKNGRGLSKHHTSLKKEDKTIGYIYYLSDFEQKTSSFIGLEVIKDNRGDGFSNAIWEVYFAISQENGIVNFQTTRQRKPFTTFILMKYGYIPNSQSPKRRAHILKPNLNQDEKLNIAFNDPEYQKQFLDSRIYRGGQYSVVGPTEGEILTTVQLHSKYRLANFELLGKKRKNNKERFELKL